VLDEEEFIGSFSMYYSDEKRKEAIHLYQEGMSSSDVAKSIGCSTVTLRNWLKSSGIPMRSRGSIYHKRKDEMVEMFRNGENVNKIADRIGCCSATVIHYLRDSGLMKQAIKNIGSFFSKEDKNKVVSMYVDEHKSLRECADFIGCSSQSVHLWLKKRGIETRKRGRYNFYTEEEVSNSVELYRSGHSMAEISNLTGCCKATIKIWLNKHNVSVRKHRITKFTPFIPIAHLMFEKNRPYLEIQKRIGCSYQTVVNWKKKWVKNEASPIRI